MTAQDAAGGVAARWRRLPRPGLRVPAILLALAAAGAALPSLTAAPLLQTLLTQAVINAVLATGVGFLVRQNGLVSFGHAAFFGVAAYIVTMATARHLMPAEAAIVIAVVVPMLLAFLLGLAILRIAGVAFSMLTLAVAQALYELMLRWRSLGNGDDGIGADLPHRLFGADIALFQQPARMFVVCWLALMVVLVSLGLLARSHFGTLTLAIRNNEERARFIGYETLLPRAAVYALSAGIAALAGVLFALYNGFVTPEVLHWSLSGEALVMAVIGGTRAVWGPACGAVIFFLFKDVVGDVTEHWPAITGATLIAVTVLLPRGISGALASLARRLGAAQ
jgi:branched-chain amino acid transport system permease protein